MKKAIIAVSFGTSYIETRKKTIEAIEKRLAMEFPDYQVFRAFTSNKVIKKIKEQEQVTIDTVDQLMRKLKAQGYAEIYVQPLHIINGSEYSKALHQAMRYQKEFDKVSVGQPLLTNFADYQAVVAWLRKIAKRNQKKEALVLMGHGTQHASFTAYTCLDHLVMDEPIYICAVESYPPIDSVIKKLRTANYQKVQLYPLMLVAGDHATKDMASDSADSWKSQLERAGFTVETKIIGMGESPEIQNLFIKHAKNAIEKGK